MLIKNLFKSWQYLVPEDIQLTIKQKYFVEEVYLQFQGESLNLDNLTDFNKFKISNYILQKIKNTNYILHSRVNKECWMLLVNPNNNVQSSFTNSSSLECLLYVYINILCLQRKFKYDYEHYKGNTYKLVGLVSKNNKLKVYGKDIPDIYTNVDTKEEVIVSKKDTFDFNKNLVLYTGKSGNWARELDKFLGLTEDGQIRFK